MCRLSQVRNTNSANWCWCVDCWISENENQYHVTVKITACKMLWICWYISVDHLITNWKELDAKTVDLLILKWWSSWCGGISSAKCWGFMDFLNTENQDPKIYNFFWWLLTSTATGQLILNWNCYQVYKPEMELHMIDIIYAALPMCAQTEKTTFSCKDN